MEALRTGVAVKAGITSTFGGFEVNGPSHVYRLAISGHEVILKTGDGAAGQRSVSSATATE